MVVLQQKKRTALNVNGHNGHASPLARIHAMVLKVDFEIMMESIVQTNVLKKINDHVPPIALLFVMKLRSMVLSSNTMSVM